MSGSIGYIWQEVACVRTYVTKYLLWIHGLIFILMIIPASPYDQETDLLVSVWAEDLLTSLSPWSDVCDLVLNLFVFSLYYKEMSSGLFHR